MLLRMSGAFFFVHLCHCGAVVSVRSCGHTPMYCSSPPALSPSFQCCACVCVCASEIEFTGRFFVAHVFFLRRHSGHCHDTPTFPLRRRCRGIIPGDETSCVTRVKQQNKTNFLFALCGSLFFARAWLRASPRYWISIHSSHFTSHTQTHTAKLNQTGNSPSSTSSVVHVSLTSIQRDCPQKQSHSHSHPRNH